jgi:DnaA family protein
MRQLPLPLASNLEPTFDNFLPGGNAGALAHLRGLASAAGPVAGTAAAPPPVYLWGPGGCGKSHLLGALRAAVAGSGGATLALGPRGQAGELGDRLPSGRAPRLVTIDDCEALDTAAQARAFRAFVDAAGSVTQVVAAGRVPPVDLPLREDLRTRLGWGPVFALVPADDAQIRDALRREAERRGLPLSDTVIDHLLTRFARDLKPLMALLDRLDRYALAERRPVTLPLLRQMLDEPEVE